MSRRRRFWIAAIVILCVACAAAAARGTALVASGIDRMARALGAAHDAHDGLGLPCAPRAWADETLGLGVRLARPECWSVEVRGTPAGRALLLRDAYPALGELLVERIPAGEAPPPGTVAGATSIETREVGPPGAPLLETEWRIAGTCGGAGVRATYRVARILSASPRAEAVLAVAEAIAASVAFDAGEAEAGRLTEGEP